MSKPDDLSLNLEDTAIEDDIKKAKENPDIISRTIGVRIPPKLWRKFRYFCKHDLGVRLEKGVEEAFTQYMQTAKKENKESS